MEGQDRYVVDKLIDRFRDKSLLPVEENKITEWKLVDLKQQTFS